MNNVFTGDRKLVTARQLGAEHGVLAGPDDTVEILVAAIMGAAPREVSEVRSHSHGLAVTMRDDSGYVLVLQGAPDAAGNVGILLAAPLRYPVSMPVFTSRGSKPEPVLEAEPKPKRRLRRERPAPPDPVALAAAAAWEADPVGVAERELAEVEAALEQIERAENPNYNDRLVAKRKRTLAQSRLREAKAIARAPGERAAELQLWSNAWRWANDMVGAATAYEAYEIHRRWVERWPTAGRLVPHMAQHELEVAASWLATNAPDVLAQLVAEDTTAVAS